MVQFGRMEGYEDNLDLRIQFMLNKLNDEEFKKRLQQREKQNAKKQEYLNIVGMFVNCQTEIFYRIDNMIDTTANDMMQTQIEALVNESDRLMEYTNECLKNISKTYSSTKYHFEYNFELKSR
jgi:3'-phosphoadenosine 5'-phosphosulfate sulfotransferase